MTEQENKIELKEGMCYFNAAVQIGESLYYSAKYMNGLFRADLATGKSEYITMFDTEREEDIHKLAFSEGNKIWFIPSYIGEKIAIFHIDSCTMEYVEIPDPKKVCDGFLFMEYVRKEDVVWLVPGVYGAFLRVNVKTGELRRIKLPIEEYEKVNFPVIQGCERDDKIYLCPWDDAGIFYLDLKSEEVKTIDIETKQNFYRNIFIFDNCIYLFPRVIPNDILKMDLGTKKCENIGLHITKEKTPIVAIHYERNTNRMFLFPQLEEEKIFILDLESQKASEIEMPIDSGLKISEGAFWRDMTYISEDTFYVMSNDKMAPILEYRDNVLKPFLLEGPKELLVRKLVDLVARKEKENEKMKHQGNIGEKIYKAIFSDNP